MKWVAAIVATALCVGATAQMARGQQSPNPVSPPTSPPTNSAPLRDFVGPIPDPVGLSSPSEGPVTGSALTVNSQFAQPSRDDPFFGNWRVEGGAGYNNGGADTTASIPGLGSVSTDLLSGGGITAEAGLWFDNPLGVPTISLGAQYLYFDDSGSTTLSSAAGPILGLASATSNLSLTTNAAMFNAEWRPSLDSFHPFLGTGVGVAFTTLSGSVLGFSTSNSQTNVAGQVFLGFDYDLTSNIYAGVTGRFFITDATYHLPNIGISDSIDITNRPISLMAHLGLRF